MQHEAGIAVSIRPRRIPFAKAPSAVLRFARKKPLGIFGAALVVVMVALTLAAPVVAPYDPHKTSFLNTMKAPSSDHWFGTDALGRDVFSRTIYGAKVSLYVGLVAMFIEASFGLLLGVSSAYYGGRFDLIVQRVVDGLIAIPRLVLALAIVAVLPPSMNNIILAIAISGIPRVTRVIRSAALSIKENVYIDAARAVGASNWRVMLRHVMPNTFAPLIVIATGGIGQIIISESSLSFLGVGVPFSVISWGGMLSGDTREFMAGAPWMAIGPVFALTLMVFGINMFGDALRDVLDPKLRGR